MLVCAALNRRRVASVRRARGEQLFELVDHNQQRGTRTAVHEQLGYPVRHNPRLADRHLEHLTQSDDGVLARPQLANDERSQPGGAAGEPRQDASGHQRRLAGAGRTDRKAEMAFTEGNELVEALSLDRPLGSGGVAESRPCSLASLSAPTCDERDPVPAHVSTGGSQESLSWKGELHRPFGMSQPSARSPAHAAKSTPTAPPSVAVSDVTGVPVAPTVPVAPAVPVVPATSAVPAVSDTTTHCPYRQAALLQQALASNKMRVGFLLGAGCPMSIRVPDGAGTKVLIPDIAELTNKVTEALQSSHAAAFDKVRKRLTADGKLKPNVEELLSYIRALHEIAGADGIDGLSKVALDELDRSICDLTNTVVGAQLPTTDTPYHQLATWVAAIDREFPVELFTSNYDLLLEQSLEERNVPYFDGFSGTHRTFFDLTSIEQARLPARWARLWKLHGSINWWQTRSGQIQRRPDGAGDRLLIHPSHLKYDQSRRMPYLAMLDRLRAFLSTGQAVLVTCGFSFADEHINDVLIQSLNGNPKAMCFGLLFGDRADSPHALAVARKHANFSLLAADGAVLGTIDRNWHAAPLTENAFHKVAVAADLPAWRTKAPAERCGFLLGDFAALGKFFAEDLSSRDLERRVTRGG